MNHPLTISVILPVYNEERCLGKNLEWIRKTSTLHPVEIIVVDGKSTDHTGRIAESNADQVYLSPKRGRGSQMHLGALRSTGDLLLFLHADTQLPRKWQNVIQEVFQSGSPKMVAAAFQLRFDSDQLSYRIISAFARLRTKLTGVIHSDQALVVRRKEYFSSGGFPDVPLMEEYLFIPRLRQLGPIKIFEENIVTSSRKYQKNGPLKNSLRNFLFVLLFYLGISPRKLAEWYR